MYVCMHACLCACVHACVHEYVNSCMYACMNIVHGCITFVHIKNKYPSTSSSAPKTA